MNKEEINQKLQESHREFVNFLATMDRERYESAPPGKWTPGQHLDHILRAVTPVRLAFSLPKWIAKLLFKKANRPTRTYGDLIQRYHEKLGKGGRASGRFLPGSVQTDERAAVCRRLEKQVSALSRSVEKYKENELDRLVLPHPLLGKLTLREMLYFTIYHAEHHQKNMERDLQALQPA